MTIWFLYEKIKKYCVKETLIKTGASCFFILTACGSFLGEMGTYGHERIYKVLILAGLSFGLLGDVFLELKCVKTEMDEFYTRLGFIMFMFGHLFYIIGMCYYHVQAKITGFLLLPVLFGLALGILTVVTEKWMRVSFGKMKKIVLLYGTLLFTMLAVSGKLAIQASFHDAARNLFFIGAILFAISDEILSGTYFGEGKERPVDLISNGITYYAAQFLIGLSLSYLGT